MKTILVLSSFPDFAESVRAGLAESGFRIVHRVSTEESEPLLVHGLANACLLDADLMGVEAVWCVEKIRRHNKKIPLIVFTGSAQAEWEEEALLRGVNQILSKPVKPRLLISMLERFWHTDPGAAQRPAMSVPAGNTAIFARASTDPAAGSRFVNTTQTLDVLRDFSAILTHSLDAEALLKQFLQFLREILSINRAAIFLNRPCSPLAEAVEPVDGRRLRSAAAIGLNGSLLEHFELSLDSGIGAQIARLGRILRRDSDEARLDAEAQKEFELLGGQVAVPITNRDATIGVAVFDGRITGEPLVNVELELIFHLLEQVGLALRNIWLHDQIAGSNTMMTAVLRELNSACIVVSRDLKVLHANKAVRHLLGRRSERPGQIEFSDLPAELGSDIYKVLNSGAALDAKKYQPANAPDRLFDITVLPLRHGSSAAPISALLIAEDIAEREQLSRLQTEAAKLRLLRDMSFRLANEIRMVVTPIHAHHQLLNESWKDPEFKESLDEALDHGIKRILRLSDQMRFLSPESLADSDIFAISKVIEEAFQEAKNQETGTHEARHTPRLKLKTTGTASMVKGNRSALKHAFAEILLNAMQSNPKKPEIDITLRSTTDGKDRLLTIEVQDAGNGFSAEEARLATVPFFAGRERVGTVGLGLTVSQKIIESHHGKLEIVPSESGVVRVTLPLEDHAN